MEKVSITELIELKNQLAWLDDKYKRSVVFILLEGQKTLSGIQYQLNKKFRLKPNEKSLKLILTALHNDGIILESNASLFEPTYFIPNVWRGRMNLLCRVKKLGYKKVISLTDSI